MERSLLSPGLCFYLYNDTCIAYPKLNSIAKLELKKTKVTCSK
jgi:hypothetical protein